MARRVVIGAGAAAKAAVAHPRTIASTGMDLFIGKHLIEPVLPCMDLQGLYRQVSPNESLRREEKVWPQRTDGTLCAHPGPARGPLDRPSLKGFPPAEVIRSV